MSKISAKPFLKWAGGKTQLLPEISKKIPHNFRLDKFTYVEPFVGSGAVFFWILNEYPNIEKAIINDVNQDLINCYQMIAKNPKELTEILKDWEREFHAIDKEEVRRRNYYAEKRELFNKRISENLIQASLFIFLNKTCFNGLYRVNRSNQFNVPIGRFTCPTICQVDNIYAVSQVLQKVDILCGDFEETLKGVSMPSLFYLDPPYKPLNETSSFNTYSKDEFGDREQERLRDFCHKLNERGHSWILSNSDVANFGSNDTFFDILYDKYSISRVKAKRFINSKGASRGEINELLITNISKTKKLNTI